MNYYQQAISRYTECDDLEIVIRIETLMIETYRTLDALTPEQFRRAAVIGHSFLKEA